MADPPKTIIRKKTCPEHLCRILAELRIVERISSGELRIRPHKPSLKRNPFTDHNGRRCVINQMYDVLDDRFAPPDPRHRVARLHHHITDSGEVGASGKYDPRVITTVEGLKYERMQPQLELTCDLCEGGDMIPPDGRFYDSVYRPAERADEGSKES